MLAKESKPLGELAADITVGYVGQMMQEYVDNGIPFLRSLNIRAHSFDSCDLKYISKDFHAKIKKSALKPGDVVIVRTGNAGISCVIPASLTEANCSDLIIIRCGENLDPYFLSYYINFITYSQIKDHLVGAIQKHFNIGSAKSIPFPIIRKSRQSKIASILKALDAKIELNNRINAELEVMAKTLYDFWFEQFDFPDENGEPYKSSGGKMIFNSVFKRKIPEKWEVVPISSIAPLTTQSINPSDFPEKKFRYFSIPGFDKTKTFKTEFGKYIESHKFSVEPTDLLISKLNPWFNRVVYAPEGSDQICSTEFVVCRCPASAIKNYLFMLARSPHFIAHCIQSATGTSNSHKRVNPTVMMQYKISYDQRTVQLFGEQINPLINKIIANQQENQELGQLREWLLPMLMNGQISVI